MIVSSTQHEVHSQVPSVAMPVLATFSGAVASGTRPALLMEAHPASARWAAKL